MRRKKSFLWLAWAFLALSWAQEVELKATPVGTGQLAPEEAELRVRLLLALPGREAPAEGTLRLGDRAVRVQGEAVLRLPPGTYPLALEAPGARVEGPKEVRLSPGGKEEAVFRLLPEVALSLTPEAQRLPEGQTARLLLRATTPYPGLLPAELALELPEGLEALGATRITAPLSKERALELALEVKGASGTYPVAARLLPYGKKAEAMVVFFRPASFTLAKEALTPKVAKGDEARFRLTVANEGDEAGRVRLLDQGGPGLEGKGLEEEVVLGPGEKRSYEVAFRVTADQALNRAQLLDEKGKVLARAEAGLEVLLPRPELSRTLPFRRYVPGEEVEHRLVVQNTGQAPLRYTLEDACPDFLEPASARFQGVLAPGEERVHTYRARVRFGPEAEGVCQTTLLWEGGRLLAETPLARLPLRLKAEPLPPRLLEGTDGSYLLRAENPADHPVRARLLFTPPRGVEVEGLDWEGTLEAGGVKEFALAAKALPAGGHTGRLSAFVGETPAAFPAEATLVALPLLVPERRSEVRLPFRVDGEGEGLLLAFRLPQGAEYVPGSARLDGAPLEDPRVLGDRLFFRLPFQKAGEVRLTLRHREALPPLEAPSLTLLVGGREVFLQGEARLEDFKKARPLEAKREGLILEPSDGRLFQQEATRVVLEGPLGELVLKVNGKPIGPEKLGKREVDEGKGWQRLEYYGVPLEVGKNVLSVEGPSGELDRVEVYRAGNPVRLRLSLEGAQVDGRTPLRLLIEALDENGLPSGFGPVTLESGLEPVSPDAFLEISGYQALLKDGRAEVLLRPLAAPREFPVRARFNQLEAEARFFAGSRKEALWLAQGSVGVALVDLGQGLSLESLRLFGLARAYAEGPFLEGQAQLALDTTGGLNQKPDPNRFPVTGAASEAVQPLPSEDPVAFRYDQEAFSLSYGKAPLGPGLPEATALRLETRGETRFSAFLALLPQGRVREEIVPDGTSFYRLSHRPRPGSLTLTLVEGAREALLKEGVDYRVDDLGNLQLSRPLFPTTPDLAPVRLLAEYAPQDAPRDLLAYGVGATWEGQGFRLGVAAAYLGSWRLGAEAGYRQGGDALSVKAAYEGGRLSLALEAKARLGAFRLEGNLRSQDLAPPEGSARLAYGEEVGAALEHARGAGQDLTALLLEYRPKPFSLGAGLGYLWREGALALVGRAGYEEGGTRLALSHAQPFSVFPSGSSGVGRALSRLEARLPLDPNLALEAGLAYAWGEGVSGSLGLKQDLAGANLSLHYELPTASGEGNRARFGLEAPFPLSQSLSLNLSASLERSFATGEALTSFGLAARYRQEGFTATLGAETSLGQNTKLVLKGGAAGSLDEENTLFADLSYQVLPEPKGRFSLAYALFGSRFNLLTYHRLLLEKEASLEGEALFAYHEPGFQLRPGLAYRVKPEDPAANTYQLGLGVNLYLTPSFGLGGSLYYVFQPGTGADRLVYGLEGSLRVLEEVWLNLGYSFGESLLQPEGLYLRLDFFGGSR
jgi:hypothetical protein